MTYKGIYRDGIVTLVGDVDLRNGATVDVSLRSSVAHTRRSIASTRAKAKSAVRAASMSRSNPWDLMRRTKMNKKQRIAAVLEARGTWNHRRDWKGKSSAQTAAEVRERASRREQDF